MEEEISNDKYKAIEQVENVKENVKLFTERWVEYAKEEKGFIKEDIEQVFILQVLQRYKYQQVKKLSKYLTRGLTTSAIIFSIGIGFLLFNLQTKTFSAENNRADSTDQKVERIVNE